MLGTPDYARWEWVVTEKLYGWAAPGGYADEHIGHYTREELIARYTGMGWTHEDTRYILRGELILAFRKPRSMTRLAPASRLGPPRCAASRCGAARRPRRASSSASLRGARISYDDAWITYRYAYNLAAGDGFVYNPGERVFGTSAPGYALLLARAVAAESRSGCRRSARRSARCRWPPAARRSRSFGTASAASTLAGVVAGLVFVVNPLALEAFSGEMVPQAALALWAATRSSSIGRGWRRPAAWPRR